MNFEAARDFILNKLKTGLRSDLYYHCYSHTVDVYEAATRLATMEKINAVELVLLETAALYHDSGFLMGYNKHEELSILFVKEYLPEFGYSENEIEVICNMISATQLPQSPQTHLEKILCDADLDYLGRDDFFMVANKLLCEWNEYGMSTSLKNWYHIQAEFLNNNTYFTNSAIILRNEKKSIHLEQIKDLIS
jgi:uncharacterized protein